MLQRTESTVREFTDRWLRDLPFTIRGQKLYWDTDTKGLCVLMGSHTKTFRVQIKLHGQWRTITLGHHPAMSLASARDAAYAARQMAEAGRDPRQGRAPVWSPNGLSFERVVDMFIRDYAKPRQRTWNQTEQVLRAVPWQQRPIDSLTKPEIRYYLRQIIAEGHHSKAQNCYRWLYCLWKWAYCEDLCKEQIMAGVRIEFERQKRDRVYSDDEIRTIWHAAETLPPEEAVYIKLMILLAPRKTALALISKPDIKGQLWVTPFELTKSRKTADEDKCYLTPLPTVAAELINSVMKSGRLFPTLPIYKDKGGRPRFDHKPLVTRLIQAGAPQDLIMHTFRHTCASWFKEHGYGIWERSLLLNHSESGVTAGYSHTYPLEKKLELLTLWSNYIEGLVK